MGNNKKTGRVVKKLFSYEKTTNQDTQPVVLFTDSGYKIELYIKPLDNNYWCLICLAGDKNARPEKHHLQGPYQCWQECAAARSAIVTQFPSYHLDCYERCTWVLDAQRFAKEVNDRRGLSEVDSRFSESDVFF